MIKSFRLWGHPLTHLDGLTRSNGRSTVECIVYRASTENSDTVFSFMSRDFDINFTVLNVRKWLPEHFRG